jgi:hypothetical protein
MDDQAPASGIDALQDLERYLSGQAALGAGLSEIERESERRGREIVRLSLQAHVGARGDGDVGEAIVLAGEDGPLRLAHKRVHSRPLVTLFGELRITRMGYGAPGHDAIHPRDAELCLPARRWSYEVSAQAGQRRSSAAHLTRASRFLCKRCSECNSDSMVCQMCDSEFAVTVRQCRVGGRRSGCGMLSVPSSSCRCASISFGLW